MATPKRGSIQIYPHTLARLKAKGRFGESYDELINRLLDTLDEQSAPVGNGEATPPQNHHDTQNAGEEQEKVKGRSAKARQKLGESSVKARGNGETTPQPDQPTTGWRHP